MTWTCRAVTDKFSQATLTFIKSPRSQFEVQSVCHSPWLWQCRCHNAGCSWAVPGSVCACLRGAKGSPVLQSPTRSRCSEGLLKRHNPLPSHRSPQDGSPRISAPWRGKEMRRWRIVIIFLDTVSQKHIKVEENIQHLYFKRPHVFDWWRLTGPVHGKDVTA